MISVWKFWFYFIKGMFLGLTIEQEADIEYFAYTSLSTNYDRKHDRNLAIYKRLQEKIKEDD